MQSGRAAIVPGRFHAYQRDGPRMGCVQGGDPCLGKLVDVTTESTDKDCATIWDSDTRLCFANQHVRQFKRVGHRDHNTLDLCEGGEPLNKEVDAGQNWLQLQRDILAISRHKRPDINQSTSHQHFDDRVEVAVASHIVIGNVSDLATKKGMCRNAIDGG